MKAKTNPDVSAAAKLSLQELYNVRQMETSAASTIAEVEAAKQRLADSRQQFRKEIRSDLAQNRDNLDSKLHDIFTNPAALFRSIRAASKGSGPAVKTIHSSREVTPLMN